MSEERCIFLLILFMIKSKMDTDIHASRISSSSCLQKEAKVEEPFLNLIKFKFTQKKNDEKSKGNEPKWISLTMLAVRRATAGITEYSRSKNKIFFFLSFCHPPPLLLNQ